MSSLRISSIEGNRQCLDGGAMFGNVPRSLWEKWIQPDSKARIPLACRCLLVEFEGKHILCETGIGSFFEPKLAERFGVQDYGTHKLIDNLKNHNMEEEDIDYCVLSHLHFDHAGGLLPTFDEISKKGMRLLFPKARYLLGVEAYKRALKPHFRDRASFIPGLVQLLQNSRRLDLIQTEKDLPLELKEIINFFFTHGHTPGQMHAIFKGKKNSIVYAADLIPGEAWVHLPITMGYDRYPEKLIDEKKNLYRKMTLYSEDTKESSSFFFFTHDPHFSCSKVKETKEGRFVPIELQKSLNHFEI